MIWDSLLLILHPQMISYAMSKNKYRSKKKYKVSLYSNLLIGCVLSERNEEKGVIRPKMVAKACPSFQGGDVRQQTFVMRWNPEISSHKVVDFEHAMEDFFEDGFYYDWSIFDYEKVQVGDRFFMLKVGHGNTGIVMSGIIVSLPYRDEDWSGKGREVRYVRMIPDCMVHPDKSRMVTIQMLDEALPGVNWNEGHSGVILDESQALKFDELWRNFLSRYTKEDLLAIKSR